MTGHRRIVVMGSLLVLAGCSLESGTTAESAAPTPAVSESRQSASSSAPDSTSSDVPISPVEEGPVEDLVALHGRGIEVDFDPIDDPSRVLAEHDAVAVVRGQVTGIGPGLTVYREHQPNTNGPPGEPVIDPDEEGDPPLRPNDGPWMQFTTMQVEVEEAIGQAEVGDSLQVQVMRNASTTQEEVDAVAAGTAVVFALVELPDWDDEPALREEAPGALGRRLTPLVGGDWFAASDGEAISPFARLEEVPAGWGDPTTLDDIAAVFGVD